MMMTMSRFVVSLSLLFFFFFTLACLASTASPVFLRNCSRSAIFADVDIRLHVLLLSVTCYARGVTNVECGDWVDESFVKCSIFVFSFSRYVLAVLS